MRSTLNDSKIWSSIRYIIKQENNNLSDYVLRGIIYVILHRYPLTLGKGNDEYTLVNKASSKVYVNVRRFDHSITDYNRVIEKKDGYYYIQKLVKQKDLTNQYLQIKIHKDFFKIFCY